MVHCRIACQPWPHESKAPESSRTGYGPMGSKSFSCIPAARTGATRMSARGPFRKVNSKTNEDPLAAAQREFAEETGIHLAGEFRKLTSRKQRSGKVIHAWALEAEVDVANLRSNTFTIVWPPGSGKVAEFPEVDRGEWFGIATAMQKINAGSARVPRGTAASADRPAFGPANRLNAEGVLDAAATNSGRAVGEERDSVLERPRQAVLLSTLSCPLNDGEGVSLGVLEPSRLRAAGGDNSARAPLSRHVVILELDTAPLQLRYLSFDVIHLPEGLTRTRSAGVGRRIQKARGLSLEFVDDTAGNLLFRLKSQRAFVKPAGARDIAGGNVRIDRIVS